MLLLKLLAELFIFSIACILFFTIRQRLSQYSNEMKINEYFENMDVVTKSQRWRGSRSQIFESLRASKTALGIDVEMLCVTFSGRWFLINATTKWSYVSQWELTPISNDMAAKLIGVDVDDLKKIHKEMIWSKKCMTNLTSSPPCEDGDS